MTQQNVFQVLKKKKKWMTSKEIAQILKINPGNVTVSLNKLFKQGEVLRKLLQPRQSIFEGGGYIPYIWRNK